MLLQQTTTLQRGTAAACRRHAAAVTTFGFAATSSSSLVACPCLLFPHQRQQQQQQQAQRCSTTLLAATAQHDRSTASVAPAHSSSTFLQTLSEEQLRPATTTQTHVRVIAGPGSGKTRTIIARVIWLLKQNVPPSSILAITFTRKAAEELKQRLQAEFGAVPKGLQARTFHSLCTSLLKSRLGVWTVAEDDDVNSIVRDLLTPSRTPQQEQQQQQQQHPAAVQGSDSDEELSSSSSSSSSSGVTTRSKSRSSRVSGSASAVSSTSSSSSSSKRTSTASSSSDDEEEKVDAGVVRYYCDMISRMKSFVETTHSVGKRKTGAAIVQQLVAEGAPGFGSLTLDKQQRVASVYDRYNWRLSAQHKMDFDDLLHQCLAMVHNEPDVKSVLHRLWRHILVDEGQDTNLCQFELISQITGPTASLFMVGDPDQAIYGFRGARSDLMQRRFDQQYGASAVTYYLSDNYRSKPPIITVADMIRGKLRPKGHTLVPGRSVRGADSAPCVQLCEAASDKEEVEGIAQQLAAWHKQGYAWDEMAVLCRTKRPLRAVYRAAVAKGIASHIHTGDMWDSPEVKAALALLRAVVYPSAAGEGLKRRIIQASTEVKVPLTAGLGGKPIEAMEAVINSQPTPPDNSSSSTSTTTLGSCLLAGCGMDSLSPQQAADIWQQWQAAAAGEEEDPMQLLQGLAPPWQQLPGLKALTKKQRAALERLRGLVRLAAAAAVVGQPPKDVLQLLLTHSGIQDALQQAPADAAREVKERKTNRLKNLQVLLELAGRAASLRDDADLMLLLDDDTDVDSLDSTSIDSADEPNEQQLDGPALLQQYMDLCGLQGDGEDGEQANKPRVQFLTAHYAKGKEYKCVVVTSFYEGVLPSERAVTPGDYEQERNTAYVAVTRAKDHLLITWPRTVGFGFRAQHTEVSSLLRDVLFEAKRGRLPGVVVR